MPGAWGRASVSASASRTASLSSRIAARCSPAGRSRWRSTTVECGDDRGPAPLRDPASLGGEDEVVRAAVRGVRDLARVAARHEFADVVANRRGRQSRLGGERARRDGLESRHPADEREEPVGNDDPRELRIDQQPDQEPRRVELLQEVDVAPPIAFGHDRIIGWTCCELVGKVLRVRRYHWRHYEARGAPRHGRHRHRGTRRGARFVEHGLRADPPGAGRACVRRRRRVLADDDARAAGQLRRGSRARSRPGSSGCGCLRVARRRPWASRGR